MCCPGKKPYAFIDIHGNQRFRYLFKSSLHFDIFAPFSYDIYLRALLFVDFLFTDFFFAARFVFAERLGDFFSDFFFADRLGDCFADRLGDFFFADLDLADFFADDFSVLLFTQRCTPLDAFLLYHMFPSFPARV